MQLKRYIPLFFLLLMLSVLSACAPSAGIFAGGNGVWQSTGLKQQQIHTLAVNPNNAQLLLAGDVQGSVFMSTDGALHWTQRSSVPSQAKTMLALSFDTTGKKLYATTEAGIFVSTNDAQTWSAVGTASSGLPLDSYFAIAFDYQAVTAIYVGSAHHGVLMSNDGGKTWSAINTGLPANVAINGLTLDSGEHQLWAATSVGVYRSDNRTFAWQAFNSGLPAHVVAYAVQPAFITGGTQGLVFVGTNAGFFRSDVSGNQWTESQESLGQTIVYEVLIDVSQPTTIYIATNKGAYRSTDNGQNWGGIANGLPKDQPVYALLFGSSGGSQLYAASNGVYMYPGDSSGFGSGQLISIVIIIFFFVLLYYFTRGSRNKRREILKPERIIESSPAPVPAQDQKDDNVG